MLFTITNSLTWSQSSSSSALSMSSLVSLSKETPRSRSCPTLVHFPLLIQTAGDRANPQHPISVSTSTMYVWCSRHEVGHLVWESTASAFPSPQTSKNTTTIGCSVSSFGPSPQPDVPDTRRSRQFAITLAMWISNVHVPVGSLRLAKNPAPELGQSWLDALLSTYNQTQLSAGGPRIYNPPLPLATGPFESHLLKKCFKNAMILQTWPRTRKRRWSLLASHKPLQNREGRPAPYCAQWNPIEMRGKLILKKMVLGARLKVCFTHWLESRKG